ncbi:hypothetical protein K7432_013141 [Basidiobolus ranarum]|uniref:Uncharacterized protein n=1 Tax=Basidiobolus ranarum TaxID=34480 RepID=A0ABR2VQE1_9FUNG
MKTGFTFLLVATQLAVLIEAGGCPMMVWCSKKSDCALPGEYPTYDCGKACYNSGYDSKKKYWTIDEDYSQCMSKCCHDKIGAKTFCYKSTYC